MNEKIFLQARRLGVADLGTLLRYLSVGCAANVLSLGIYYFATLRLLLSPVVSLFLASGSCFFISYFTNMHWSFKHQGSNALALMRYCIGYAGVFCVQWAVLFVGVDILGLSHVWIVLVGAAIGAISFYLIQRYWVFDLPKLNEPSSTTER